MVAPSESDSRKRARERRERDLARMRAMLDGTLLSSEIIVSVKEEPPTAPVPESASGKGLTLPGEPPMMYDPD